VHHLSARGNRQQSIYLDDHDRVAYLRLLGRVVRDHDWRCLAYCLMDNHVHLLIETPHPNLGIGVQRLHGVYARRFNDRHRHSGHLFQGRYGVVPIKSDEQLYAVVRYLAMNPVAAGLCSRPQDWRWSSCSRPPAWLDEPRLLEYLGAGGGDARKRYADLIA
jgi:REP element-mobilizing transposase RayT